MILNIFRQNYLDDFGTKRCVKVGKYLVISTGKSRPVKHSFHGS